MAVRNSKVDPAVAVHLEWLGFVRPTGLVVSAPALVQAGVVLNRRDTATQNRLQALTILGREGKRGGGYPIDFKGYSPDFREFATSVLGWDFSPEGYVGTDEAPIPAELELHIPDTDDRIRPTFAVRRVPLKRRHAPKSPPDASNATKEDDPAEWQLLVNAHAHTEDLDADSKRGGQTRFSPHRVMERLLRHTGIPAGLLFNGTTLRLISAPRGESSGWIDFQVSDMLTTDGRLILSAMCALLGQTRLLASDTQRNLAFLLQESRKYQNTVSEHLAEQVLHALYELVRGFQIAHDASKGELLQHLLDEDPDEIYGGFLTLVMRLIFLLYSEERDMLPQDDVYTSSYSLAGLHQRLQEDAALYPDTMDQRFGAYAQIISLSRIIHKGAKFGATQLPKRQSNLFDPDRYRFLEGRDAEHSSNSSDNMRVITPLIPDGTIYRVLEKLTVLHAERISYRALDVEHIGSVYETMMGFKLELATGQSISIKSAKKHGAPTTIDVEALLRIEPSARDKWMFDSTDRKPTDNAKKNIREANSLVEMLVALEPLIDKNATPDFVPQGAMVLQPSEERRRTGSHYTPRELSEPIVEKALEPVFTRLEKERCGPPTPDQILDIKMCDPAMGSGAFLVAACRILGNKLVEAWETHDLVPELPPDEDKETLAFRLVARRCLYGVDLNPKAVELAKMSLWLVTLARDHPLTFIDHALRHGDSLIGLAPKQIFAFHWKKIEAEFQAGLESGEIHRRIEKIEKLRQEIRDAGDLLSDQMLHTLWSQIEHEMDQIRIYGDLVISAFFEGTNPKDREKRRTEYAWDVSDGSVERHRERLHKWRFGVSSLVPFHWEIELPEVFGRENPGFDAIVGNPPFLGGKRTTTVLGANYRDWLLNLHEKASGDADLVAHFFRRSFYLIRTNGTFGLIATNSISQGETRATGLRKIREDGGTIYFARRRVGWPGLAAVVISIIHVYKGQFCGTILLDDNIVENVSAFLFHKGGDEDPARLETNLEKSFVGMVTLGMGFTFDDTDKSGTASSLATMKQLVQKEPKNKSVIFPYIGGEEVNSDPSHTPHRFVINFLEFPLRRAELGESWHDADKTKQKEWLTTGMVPSDYPGPVAANWPDLVDVIEKRVRPERQKLGDSAVYSGAKIRWWQFLSTRPNLRRATSHLSRVLVTPIVTKHLAFVFLPSNMVYAHSLTIFPFESRAMFCLLQSRVHEIWSRFFCSTLKDWLRYAPTYCFETFPFPANWELCADLEDIGEEYYNFRSHLMSDRNEGLTKTYNRFHDPNENSPDEVKLRELHDIMDRAVLDAYGWKDIPIDCDYFLDQDSEQNEKSRRSKPYRYRWPDSVRDEILARLLDLNARQAGGKG